MRILSLRFLTRRGCHLCDDARPILARVARDLGVTVEEVDVDRDEALTRAYGLRVPIVLASHDRVVAEGVIDDRRLLRDAIKSVLDL
ncbi:MAG TPA: glutaredoxin family protein [Acidimicrobiia bacterium]|nr:glutaredoxin family protein [Acidimicrobiia bacterium]